MSHAATLAPVWTCGTCGAGLDDACPQPDNRCRVDAELVVARLEQAGCTLMAMRTRSPYPAPYRCALPESIQLVVEAYGWTEINYRPPVPSSQAIDQMDGVWKWLAAIPNERRVLRRIVAARSLVDPVTGRHVIHWRRLGQIIRADYRCAQRWYSQGIDIIVRSLVE